MYKFYTKYIKFSSKFRTNHIYMNKNEFEYIFGARCNNNFMMKLKINTDNICPVLYIWRLFSVFKFIQHDILFIVCVCMTAGMHVRVNDNSVGPEQKKYESLAIMFSKWLCYQTTTNKYCIKNLVKHCLWKIVTDTFLLFCHVKKDRENFKWN